MGTAFRVQGRQGSRSCGVRANFSANSIEYLPRNDAVRLACYVLRCRSSKAWGARGVRVVPRTWAIAKVRSRFAEGSFFERGPCVAASMGASDRVASASPPAAYWTISETVPLSMSCMAPTIWISLASDIALRTSLCLRISAVVSRALESPWLDCLLFGYP